jgi:hypothetical protein
MVGEGILFGATLAPAEPLTALPRSARSRVSSGRSLCKAPTRTPSLPCTVSQLRTLSSAARVIRAGGYRSRCHSLEGIVSPGATARGAARAKRAGSWCEARGRFGPALNWCAGEVLRAVKIYWEGGRGVLVGALQSERVEETRDRAERGSVFRGSDQASVAPKRTPRPTDRENISEQEQSSAQRAAG